MRAINPSRKFQKEFKRCRARGLPMQKLKTVVSFLASDTPLPASCRPHKLGGEYASFWECHISGDWLLIYDLDDETNALDLLRTGTHADLF